MTQLMGAQHTIEEEASARAALTESAAELAAAAAEQQARAAELEAQLDDLQASLQEVCGPMNMSYHSRHLNDVLQQGAPAAVRLARHPACKAPKGAPAVPAASPGLALHDGAFSATRTTIAYEVSALPDAPTQLLSL